MMLKQIVDTTTTTAYLGAYEPIGTLPRRHTCHTWRRRRLGIHSAHVVTSEPMHTNPIPHRNDTTYKFWIKNVQVRVEFAVRGASKWENR
jgi:hypothetical protein